MSFLRCITCGFFPVRSHTVTSSVGDESTVTKRPPLDDSAIESYPTKSVSSVLDEVGDGWCERGGESV
jgi:hypothetical protein